MKSFLSFLSSGLVILGLTACGTARDSTSGSEFCFGCHSETTELGKKILWAEAGYDLSVHKNGQIGRIYTLIPDPPEGCAPWPAGSCFVPTATEFEGSNAFYANSTGCQMCHTSEGFRKRAAGEYDAPDGSYSIRYQWNTRAGVGSPSAPNPNVPLTSDVIKFPSPLGCFGCHTPHGTGTPDGVTLPQTIPAGTPITTQVGGVWGKAKGNICAECHEVRLNEQPSTSASIVAGITTGTGKFNVGSYYGTHHGPQTDMLLGDGGAQYVGTTAGGFTFADKYNNSPHTDNPNADCISCHMQDDYSDIAVTGSFSVNASVGGHSMANKGFVHGAEKVLVIGCGSTGCHKVSGVATSAGTLVEAAFVTTTLTEYVQRGDAFFRKRDASGNDTNYHLKVSELLAKLARPSADCTGLLMSAAADAGGVIGWNKMEDQTTIDRRCISAGSTTGINKSATAKDDNTNASVRFLKALWNFKFVQEDKSFSVHNTRYALELLYDSCADLSELTTPGSCGGHTDGQCDACNTGPYVTARP